MADYLIEHFDVMCREVDGYQNVVAPSYASVITPQVRSSAVDITPISLHTSSRIQVLT
jgi:hypothetical protein